MSEHETKMQREAFVAGFRCAARRYLTRGDGGDVPEIAQEQAYGRYPIKHIVEAPSGLWYTLGDRWRELRGYDNEHAAYEGKGEGYFCGVKSGDERAVAHLFTRIADEATHVSR